MPHLVVEFSQNIERHVDIAALVRAVHNAACEIDCFEIGTIRTRASPRAHYVVGNGDEKNAFLALDVRMGPGQSEETRLRIGRHIFAAVDRHIAGARERLNIRLSLELRESSSVRIREEPHHSAGSHEAAARKR